MKKLTPEEIEKRNQRLEILKTYKINVSDICRKYKIVPETLYRKKARTIKYDFVLKDIYKNNLKVNKQIEKVVFDHEEN